MILVATPARLGTPRALIDRHMQVWGDLAGPGKLDHILYYNEQAREGGKYEPNARARNQLIERHLRTWHRWVLWLDVDIIEAPGNLVDVLMETAARKGGEAIVAPMVWVERVGDGPASIPVGGWFYDTGGFQQMDGSFADFGEGVRGNGEEVEMRSVGCCYLAPAGLYRRGMRYRPVGDEVEHLSFMREARKAGATVWATRRANVVHAYLPRWGEQWHSS